MKTNPLLRSITLLASLALPSTLQALEVHEWGTFTILVSSTGQRVSWYQPYSDIAKLPPFVQGDLMQMKGNIRAASVRMETPVIYFYPEQETPISVRVGFSNGMITERFPAASSERFAPQGTITMSSIANIACVATPPTSERIFDERLGEFANLNQPTVTRWTGKLLPPDHADAKLIPVVNPAKGGENYAAARNVPDAWIFRSDNRGFYPNIEPVEKFIFYRGAGDAHLPYQVSMSDDQSVKFDNYSQSANTFQVVLRVKDGKASWKQLPNTSGPSKDANRSASITFPKETISLEQADKELRALFLTELTSHGLTKDEAQAMIDTWNHTWFAEPGQRVFTIVDRTWVDSVLPLGITPEPKKTERVFVARYEILSPSAEKQLETIMTQHSTAESSSKQLAALELGRFQNGAVELIAEKVKQEHISRVGSLIQTAAVEK
jgi:hypothetical protein